MKTITTEHQIADLDGSHDPHANGRSTRSRCDARRCRAPAGFSPCTPRDRALLPFSVRTIADALASDTLGLLEHRGTACVRSALRDYRALLTTGNHADEVYFAVGRIQDVHGKTHDHAWVVEQHYGSPTVRDRAARVHSHEPLVLLSRDAVWTHPPAALVPDLRPGFFLTVHCAINDEALKGLFKNDDEIDDVNHMNARADDPFSHPNYDPREHFDNALITESIALLADRLTGDNRLHTVYTGAPPSIPHGLACHAIADFYSHTNYAPMALAYYKTPERVPTIDKAIQDTGFLQFVTRTWKNLRMWQDYKGYSTTTRPAFGKGFERCLFSGGYGGDGWTPREGIPHHDDFAVDQLGNAWIKAPPILSRRNPFAPPGPWEAQYNLRFRLAIDHLRAIIERSQKGDPNPFLGDGQTLPDVLVPPPWKAATRAYLVRGTDGRPEEVMA